MQFLRRKFIKIFLYIYIFYCLSPFPWFNKTIVPQTEFIEVSFILIFISFVLIGIKLLKDREIIISRIDIMVLIWFLYLIISYLFIQAKAIDFTTLFSYFSPFILYAIFRNGLTSKDIYIIMYIIVIAVFSQVLFCIYHTGDIPFKLSTPVSATFFNSGLFGGYLATGIITTVILILFNASKKYNTINKIILLLLLTIFCYFLYLTSSRAGIIALFIAIPLLLGLKVKKLNSKIYNYLKTHKLLFLSISGSCQDRDGKSNMDHNTFIFSELTLKHGV